jgi:hypothetical protein
VQSKRKRLSLRGGSSKYGCMDVVCQFRSASASCWLRKLLSQNDGAPSGIRQLDRRGKEKLISHDFQPFPSCFAVHHVPYSRLPSPSIIARMRTDSSGAEMGFWIRTTPGSSRPS